jgi:hypothetical protein
MVFRADLIHSESCRSEKSILIPPTFDFPDTSFALRFYVLVLFPLAYYVTSQFTPWFSYLTVLGERRGEVKNSLSPYREDMYWRWA